MFADEHAVVFGDPAHSIEEVREYIVGHSARHRLLVVWFTEREHEVVRVIGAREATRREQRDYEQGL